MGRGCLLQSPNVSDLLSGPLGHCILQSVCKNVFNQLKRFLPGKNCRFLIGLPLLSGSATTLPSAAFRSRLSGANLKPFPYCLISISGFEGRTETHWHDAVPLFEQSTRSNPLNACQYRPVDYYFNPALHMSLMLSCEIHRITISNRQGQNLHRIIKEGSAIEMEAFVWKSLGLQNKRVGGSCVFRTLGTWAVVARRTPEPSRLAQ